MSRSNDAGHFFQTSEALATTERKAAKAKNKHGDPIKLPSKILAAHPGPPSTSSDSVFVAEAAGDIKRIDLGRRKTERLFSQSDAPLTCLDVDASNNIFAGSWDKTIYYIPASGNGGDSKKLKGHTDFVKCLLRGTVENRHPILISGGADATIIVWDLSPSNFGRPLHKLKGHTKAVQDLAIDPLSVQAVGDSFTLFSASSDREIRQWHVSLSAAYELPESLEKPILAHETSVYKIRFDDEGDLWTASADKTAKHLVRSRDWEADTTLEHADFVRDIWAFENLGLVATACRDEEVRVWEISSGKLVCVYSGHFEEVTALSASQDGTKVVSVSIDGTVRRWSLSRAAMAQYLEELAKEAPGEPTTDRSQQSGSALTAEEEAELAELMEDDD